LNAIRGNVDYVEANSGSSIIQQFVEDVKQGVYHSESQMRFSKSKSDLKFLQITENDGRLFGAAKILFESEVEIKLKAEHQKRHVHHEVDLFCNFKKQKSLCERDKEGQPLIPWKVLAVKKFTPDTGLYVRVLSSLTSLSNPAKVLEKLRGVFSSRKTITASADLSTIKK
jgi:hypothetical protein